MQSIEDTHSRLITYGSILEIKHHSSDSSIAVELNSAKPLIERTSDSISEKPLLAVEIDPCIYKLTLVPSANKSASANWLVLPCYCNRNLGDAVVSGDFIILVNFLYPQIVLCPNNNGLCDIYFGHPRTSIAWKINTVVINVNSNDNHGVSQPPTDYSPLRPGIFCQLALQQFHGEIQTKAVLICKHIAPQAVVDSNSNVLPGFLSRQVVKSSPTDFSICWRTKELQIVTKLNPFLSTWQILPVLNIDPNVDNCCPIYDFMSTIR